MLRSITKLRIPSWTNRPVANLRWYSDDEKPDKKLKDKIEKPKEGKVRNPDAAKRLNALLENMSTQTAAAELKVQTAPQKKPKKVEKSHEESIKEITGVIAKKIGGNVEQTEKELLTKLLGMQDLKSSGSLSDLISGMKVDDQDRKAPQKRKGPPREQSNDKEFYSRADNVRKAMGGERDSKDNRDKTYQRPRRTEVAPPSGVVNLFGKKPLGLFTKASEAKDPLETWSKLEQRELKLAVTHPPSNYFEKMIMWTEQGKLWKFPIDNEQGMEDEKAVDFSEHILLEMQLDGWCPTSGPVRHFMELVCVGLSKNHFLTAAEKKNHIMWYRDYFTEKKDLLGELLTLGKQQKQQPQLKA